MTIGDNRIWLTFVVCLLKYEIDFFFGLSITCRKLPHYWGQQNKVYFLAGGGNFTMDRHELLIDLAVRVTRCPNLYSLGARHSSVVWSLTTKCLQSAKVSAFFCIGYFLMKWLERKLTCDYILVISYPNTFALRRTNTLIFCDNNVILWHFFYCMILTLRYRRSALVLRKNMRINGTG